ncbi:hypothetical protein [Paraburkholderia caribensis]|uniref:hypothetical protein n=1 Tax=Paraburkholderia caribensis TaxID=75105 RepID=UPI0009EEF383|nr:hypothetical protein [Paraburkholderia caribensis]
MLADLEKTHLYFEGVERRITDAQQSCGFLQAERFPGRILCVDIWSIHGVQIKKPPGPNIGASGFDEVLNYGCDFINPIWVGKYYLV